ncbi:MAG: MBL fold metallo-hydrolase [Candidatus Thorarchaeota archaeon]|nr:MBL fold metallo-hydrolase [Candidatus Thorarchaeota archaeon]
MRLTIVYDNEAVVRLKSGWGFSCLVGENVLFDTGADYKTLLFNMQQLKIDFAEINTIVLSHAHGDHTGGIEIVRQLGDVRVFVPSSFFPPIRRLLSGFRNVETVEVTTMIEIVEGITTTGEIDRTEQSLIVQTSKGLVIVTGCSHPGVDTIMSIAEEHGPVRGIIGGFHGFDRLGLLGDLEMIVPCHCTKHKRRILSEFSKTSSHCAAGMIFEL